VRCRGWILLPLLLLAAVAPSAGADPEPPLTDEDVVRLYVSGTPTEEILRAIAEREPGYDLSPEMLEELRNVELPETLIQAMLGRVAAQRERREREAAAARAETAPVLTLHLNRDRGGGISVRIKAKIDPQLAAEMELGNAPEDRVFADLALFVACITPDHVPDQWRLDSPLGRDFEHARRHRLLAFVSGADAEGEEGGTGHGVRLDTPPSIEIPLEPGVVHDLWVGLAVLIGGHYRVVASDVRHDVLLGEDGLELDAKVRGGSIPRFRVSLGEDDDEDEDDENEADDEGTDQSSLSETSVDTPGSSIVTP